MDRGKSIHFQNYKETKTMSFKNLIRILELNI